MSHIHVFISANLWAFHTALLAIVYAYRLNPINSWTPPGWRSRRPSHTLRAPSIYLSDRRLCLRLRYNISAVHQKASRRLKTLNQIGTQCAEAYIDRTYIQKTQIYAKRMYSSWAFWVSMEEGFGRRRQNRWCKNVMFFYHKNNIALGKSVF